MVKRKCDLSSIRKFLLSETIIELVSLLKVKTFLLVLAATMFLIAILISGLFTIANEVAYLKKAITKHCFSC